MTSTLGRTGRASGGGETSDKQNGARPPEDHDKLQEAASDTLQPELIERIDEGPTQAGQPQTKHDKTPGIQVVEPSHPVPSRLPTPIHAPALERNPGMLLDLDWVYSTRINRSAVERRASTLSTRRTVKKEWQAA